MEEMNDNAKLSSSLEDYLEVIYNITQSDVGVARCKDIAEQMDVAKSSVTGALKQLSERNLVNYKPYGYVTLTEQGESFAESVAQKHEVIKSFFVEILGVDACVAESVACKAEHALGEHVVERLMDFTSFVGYKKTQGHDFVSEFHDFRS